VNLSTCGGTGLPQKSRKLIHLKWILTLKINPWGGFILGYKKWN
jgi:hypothetical protein